MNPMIEWGCATHALSGEDFSGDQSVVIPLKNGLLAGVIDGLGHGRHAQTAALAAVEVLQNNPQEPLSVLFQLCHERLRHTRGAVISLASLSFTEPTLTWLGIGNVRGMFIHPPVPHTPAESLLLRGGIVGYNMPSLRPVTLPLKPGDTLILATDGIRSGLSQDLPHALSPQGIADYILREYGRPNDDALVLVIRYRGPE